MKEAVVRGAIARQELLRITEEQVPSGGRIGVLLSNGTKLVPEEQWRADRPIDLTSSLSFRLVQVAVRDPDPIRDAKSLRRHFYVDLSPQLYLRDSLWRDDPWLYIEKVERDGKAVIFLRNSKGQEIVDAIGAGVSMITNPPWPVGEPPWIRKANLYADAALERSKNETSNHTRRPMEPSCSANLYNNCCGHDRTVGKPGPVRQMVACEIPCTARSRNRGERPIAS